MDEFDKLAETALPCWSSCVKTKELGMIHDPHCPCGYRPAIAALLRSTDAKARRETWEKAAQIVESHLNHENFYHGMIESCLEEAAKEIRAEVEKERES